MNSPSVQHEREHLDRVFLHALGALPASELSLVEDQLARCAQCREQLETLRPIVGSFTAWPTDVLRPSVPLWSRIEQRISEETGKPPTSDGSSVTTRPEWEEPGPGISCQLLASDKEKARVSMLVRLAPGAEYPAHRHAGIEELHLLYGELMIDDKKLYPGDYIRAEANTVDHRVWSATGCTCVLLTSANDVLL